MQSVRSFVFLLCLLVLGSGASSLVPEFVSAQTEEEIRIQMEEHAQRIKDLEAEINGYQKELNVVAGQKQTLQSAINELDLTRRQTSTQINLTENRISSTNLKLGELTYDIADTEQLIALDQRTLGKSLRNMAQAGEVSLVEQVFAAESLTEAWEAVDDAAALNDALRANVANLTQARNELTGQRAEEDTKKQELTAFRTDLSTQKQALDVQKSEKDKLLTQTKNQESVYQDLITRKRAERALFESALSALENSLASVGQGAAPASQTGVLAWPYSSAFADSCVGKSGALGNTRCITQYFGNTAFATANSQIYNGNGHNAIDIGMPVGTPVLAALSGSVLATGNTDATPGCYSFGKWVVLKHANGLATLYAHLSTINVSSGQSVSTGQSIGNSGMTGYATGPHLHFGVYASAGIQIMTLGQFRNTGGSGCSNATMPVAPKDAYLNPMSYL
ncbi:MAG TPA: peptidoglycan DD-metalloendopeptidase family protein [Candidatus Paceibacterota bacterium]|nr:peptidoglycan DD-metalloendopeptidase family protein [Candidatus Paceibacterota bacterium]